MLQGMDTAMPWSNITPPRMFMNMRCLLFRFILLLSLMIPLRLQAEELVVPAPAAGPVEVGRGGVHLDEFGVTTGYAWGRLKRSYVTYEALPLSIRVGFDVNSLLGIESRKGTVQLSLEPFLNKVIAPEQGMEAGLDVFARYLYRVGPSVRLVAEIGSGPTYLSIDTREQGPDGFNFLNQFGAGTQVILADNCALTLGYRFRHLSNAGLRATNVGINTNMLALGVSFLY